MKTTYAYKSSTFLKICFYIVTLFFLVVGFFNLAKYFQLFGLVSTFPHQELQLFFSMPIALVFSLSAIFTHYSIGDFLTLRFCFFDIFKKQVVVSKIANVGICLNDKKLYINALVDMQSKLFPVSISEKKYALFISSLKKKNPNIIVADFEI